MKSRIRVKRDKTLHERLGEQACRLKEKAANASGAHRDEEAPRVERWLASAELRRPT
ncbi:hypothetical protein GGQ85_000220 [Nitrobacter vulgaris]|uniref:hypothetical protein n=1 Tax=Nitrobacter vulgaris TaxID=29421 RepID=UPI00285E871B|nr:hypothetical protein [Nitrobacter vulgaris]MDR6302549.1 hypothetical protein [Nitrobacter vulgaris]